jgi:hypothetical protein
MVNRVLVGNRSTGGYGLYVSQDGDNVLTTTNAMQFDSRMGSGLLVHSYGQGSSGPGNTDIAHGLAYDPLFAVRWTDEDNISSGVATKVYTPAKYMEETEDYYGENYYGFESGITVGLVNSGGTYYLRIRNEQNYYGQHSNSNSSYDRDIYYAYVIFWAADFTDGRGL